MKNIDNYDGIDVAKIIASVLVLCIHIHPLEDIAPNISYILDNGFARLAVPFFFISSSFFLFKKINLEDDKKEKIKIFKKYIFRITILYLTWSIIYFPFTLANWIKNDIFFIKDLILYVREILILGTYGHLWYFPALIFSISLVYFLKPKIGKKALIIFSLTTYILGIIYNFYPYKNQIEHELINNILLLYKSIFITSRNGLFFGFIYVTIGCLYSETKAKRFKFKKLSQLLTIVSLVLLILESLLVKKNTGIGSDMYIMLLPSSYLVFKIFLECEFKINKKILLFLRNISTFIYTSQFLFIQIFNNIQILNNIHSMGKFISILILVFFIGLLVIKYSKKKQFKILKYLY